MALQYRQADLLAALNGNFVGHNHYLVHQCNTTTTKPAGLSAAMFRRYSSSNTYRSDYPRQPGTISVHGGVINLYGQIKPGKPSNTETAAMRVAWFGQGLAAINQLVQPGDYLNFPHGIGCGLAGGDWAVYHDLLQQFARHRPDVTMTIYRL